MVAAGAAGAPRRGVHLLRAAGSGPLGRRVRVSRRRRCVGFCRLRRLFRLCRLHRLCRLRRSLRYFGRLRHACAARHGTRSAAGNRGNRRCRLLSGRPRVGVGGSGGPCIRVLVCRRGHSRATAHTVRRWALLAACRIGIAGRRALFILTFGSSRYRRCSYRTARVGAGRRCAAGLRALLGCAAGIGCVARSGSAFLILVEGISVYAACRGQQGRAAEGQTGPAAARFRFLGFILIRDGDHRADYKGRRRGRIPIAQHACRAGFRRWGRGCGGIRVKRLVAGAQAAAGVLPYFRIPVLHGRYGTLRRAAAGAAACGGGRRAVVGNTLQVFAAV